MWLFKKVSKAGNVNAHNLSTELHVKLSALSIHTVKGNKHTNIKHPVIIISCECPLMGNNIHFYQSSFSMSIFILVEDQIGLCSQYYNRIKNWNVHKRCGEKTICFNQHLLIKQYVLKLSDKYTSNTSYNSLFLYCCWWLFYGLLIYLYSSISWHFFLHCIITLQHGLSIRALQFPRS